MDIALIVITSILAVLVIISCIYFLVYFQHPEDKWTAWFPKIVVVASLTLSCYNILFLPLDVANQRGEFEAAGGLPMGQIATAFFFTSVVTAVALIPFTMFYYEGMDEKDEYDSGNNVTKQVFYALKWCFVTVIIFVGAVLLMWFYIGYADIQTDIIQSNFVQTNVWNADFCTTASPCMFVTGATERISVSAIMYTVAVASLFGWILFAFFGGVGLPSLPFDLLIEFKHRPHRIKLQEYSDKKKLVGEQATLLLQASSALAEEKKKATASSSARKQRKYRNLENEFKRDVLFLEMQWKRLEDAYKNGGGNPIVHVFKLVVGFVGTFISIAWFLHILVYVIPNIVIGQAVLPFLNDFFEQTFPVPIIGIVFYGVFAFWLLLCVIKGTVKMGMRFLFITIHPMKMGETFMSSFVFNTGLILFCSLAVSQFCSISFAKYARYTATQTLFGNALGSLLYLHWIYDVLIFVLTGMFVLTAGYIVFKPYDYKKKPII